MRLALIAAMCGFASFTLTGLVSAAMGGPTAQTYRKYGPKCVPYVWAATPFIVAACAVGLAL